MSGIRIYQHCGHASEKSSRELENERKAAKLDSLLGAAKDSSRSLLQLVRDIRNLPMSEARAWVRTDQQRLDKAIAEASKP